jgi:hypothetical protein
VYFNGFVLANFEEVNKFTARFHREESWEKNNYPRVKIFIASSSTLISEINETRGEKQLKGKLKGR